MHKTPINNTRIKWASKNHNTTVDECIIYCAETAKPNKPQRQLYQDKNNKWSTTWKISYYYAPEFTNDLRKQVKTMKEFSCIVTCYLTPVDSVGRIRAKHSTGISNTTWKDQDEQRRNTPTMSRLKHATISKLNYNFLKVWRTTSSAFPNSYHATSKILFRCSWHKSLHV